MKNIKATVAKGKVIVKKIINVLEEIPFGTTKINPEISKVNHKRDALLRIGCDANDKKEEIKLFLVHT